MINEHTIVGADQRTDSAENSSNSTLEDKVRDKLSRKEYRDVHLNILALDGKHTVVLFR